MADLVTLDAVKAYLAITTANQDVLLGHLIARESRLIEQYTSRRFPSVTNTARRLNGTGSGMLMLPDSPILSIELLQIDGVSVAASPDGLASGYTFDDSVVYLTQGQKFPSGRQNVVCSWTAGWRESESGFIPSGNVAHTLTPSTGGAAADPVGVVFTSGAALAEVGSNAAAGQFSFANGVFTFNAADGGSEVTMTYDYVPGPVAQACIEMVGLDLKQRDNLGINSKMLGGETVTYTDKGMTPSVRAMLDPYRRLAPCG